MKSVDILVLSVDNFRPIYFMHEIAEVWKEEGVQVRVVYGPGHPPQADLVVLHTDITTVPSDYLAAVRAYPMSLNGHVADISKRLVSRNLVNRRDDYEGPVIVKSNQNSGGWQEAVFSQPDLSSEQIALSAINYQVFESTKEVPDQVWDRRDLVVEKFLPERKESYYCLRTWIFLGDKETNSISYSNEPIIKQRKVLHREAVEDVPEELRQLRQELAFDFGKFDYAIVDGKTVLYDANRTPTLGNFPKPQYLPRVRMLAQGLWYYFGETQ